MSDGGKGSTPRPFSVDREIFTNNWDNIFNTVDTEDESEESIHVIPDMPEQ